MAFEIVADSIPAKDNWGWQPYWSCQEYQLWHKLNVDAYGADVANKKFIAAWSELDSFDHNYNWCKYDSDFTNYFKRYGIDVGNWISNIFNAGSNVIDAAGSITQSASNTAKLFKWIIPLAVLIALAIASVWAYKKYAQ